MRLAAIATLVTPGTRAGNSNRNSVVRLPNLVTFIGSKFPRRTRHKPEVRNCVMGGIHLISCSPNKR